MSSVFSSSSFCVSSLFSADVSSLFSVFTVSSTTVSTGVVFSDDVSTIAEPPLKSEYNILCIF